MSLSAGARLGPYEIVAPIGAGGMGEIYKAIDTRLNRTVAIKVMPPHFADNSEMRQRFDREARTIAGLSHPNICTLHDIGRLRVEPGTADQGAVAGAGSEVDFLVLEYLEGETLADRLAGSKSRAGSQPSLSLPPSSPLSGVALNLDEALRIAIAVADALDKAHRHGIVHRDLKPANVMLSKNGVKLLDFGLAKWTQTGEDTLSAMPTRADMTMPGMILGTLQYMAPEQVEGKEADPRTDIFALGALLYEMVTGRKAFQGKSQATLISAIMTGDPPPISSLQPLTPAALDHVVKRCLAKDPDQRFQSAHSVLVQLRWIARQRSMTDVSSAVATAGRTKDRGFRIAMIAALALIIALAMPAVLYLRGPGAPETLPLRIPIVGFDNSHFAMAPNGRDVAVVAQPAPEEAPALYLRQITAPTFRKLAGTDNAMQPFWSPDSRAIAFVADGRLKRVEASGGAPKDIAPVPDMSGGSWSRGGSIVFGSPSGLFLVSAEGGTPERVTTVEAPESGHLWPWFLPDGTRYLYVAWSPDPANRIVYAGAIGSAERSKVIAVESNVAFAPLTESSNDGYLLFRRDASLFAQRFDAASLQLSGEASQVSGGIAYSSIGGRGSFDVSATGALALFQGRGTRIGRGQTGPEQFAWVNRSGSSWQIVVPTGDQYGDIDLTADQRHIAVTKLDPGSPGADIWIIDTERNSDPKRLTLDPGDDINPVWSNDGSRVAFTTFRNGNADIYIKNANGVGEETPLVNSPADEFVEAWSSDGKYLAYLMQQGGYQDIYILPLAGGKPFPIVQGPFRKNEPQFSHDSQWLAFTSDKSAPGQFEVYVISFPKADQEIKVSSGGGGQPRWRRDGKELFYRAVGSYVAVPFTPGPGALAGIPIPMFAPPTGGGGNVSSSDPQRHQWAVSPDGQRFLVRVPPQITAAARGSLDVPTAAINPPTANPNQFTARGTARGRGANLTAPALTVILNWATNQGKER